MFVSDTPRFAWRTAIADYWAGASSGERIAVIIAAGATLIAVIVAISLMVSADPKARSVASVGQYGARGAIAEAYLRSGTRHPDVAARHLAIQAAMQAAQNSGKTLKLIMPGADVAVHESQTCDGELRVRVNTTDQWTTVPSDANFELT